MESSQGSRDPLLAPLASSIFPSSLQTSRSEFSVPRAVRSASCEFCLRYCTNTEYYRPSIGIHDSRFDIRYSFISISISINMNYRSVLSDTQQESNRSMPLPYGPMTDCILVKISTSHGLLPPTWSRPEASEPPRRCGGVGPASG
jgi:hypothetical protein